MGSFNLTCSTSKQTISTGNPCYLLAIHRRVPYHALTVKYRDSEWPDTLGVADSDCYTNDLWSASSGLIEAVYDDYGDFTLSPTLENLATALEFIQRIYTNGITAASPSSTFDFATWVKANAEALIPVKDKCPDIASQAVADQINAA